MSSFIISSFHSSYRRWLIDLSSIRDLYRFRPGPKSINFHSVIIHRRPWLTLVHQRCIATRFSVATKHAFHDQGLFYVIFHASYIIRPYVGHRGLQLAWVSWLSVLRVVSAEYCTLFIMRSPIFARRRSLVCVVIFLLNSCEFEVVHTSYFATLQ